MKTRWMYAPTRSLFWPGFAELDSLFDSFGMRTGFNGSLTGPRFASEDHEQHTVLHAELPGLTAEDLELSVEDDVLTISGKSAPAVPEGYKVRARERTSLNFTQKFTLSDKMDAENIEAEMNNGILTVKVPRKAELGPKKIAIKAS